MSKKNETAGKTANGGGARCAAKHCKTLAAGKWPRWKTVSKGGKAVLRSPDGKRFYYGTAQEVRAACLLPWRRQWLAELLKMRRMSNSRTERRAGNRFRDRSLRGERND